jgi:hypothetical protein
MIIKMLSVDIVKKKYVVVLLGILCPLPIAKTPMNKVANRSKINTVSIILVNNFI